MVKLGFKSSSGKKISKRSNLCHWKWRSLWESSQAEWLSPLFAKTLRTSTFSFEDLVQEIGKRWAKPVQKWAPLKMVNGSGEKNVPHFHQFRNILFGVVRKCFRGKFSSWEFSKGILLSQILYHTAQIHVAFEDNDPA